MQLGVINFSEKHANIGTVVWATVDPKWWEVHLIFHKCLLHPYNVTQFSSQQIPPPPSPDIINRVEEQEIEEILTSREHCGKFEYFVSWKGFLNEENEWIIADKLSIAPNIIKAYHRSHPTASWSQKKMNLWYFADLPNSLCSCLICLQSPIPTPSSLFSTPEFLAFCKQYVNQKFSSAMDVTP